MRFWKLVGLMAAVGLVVGSCKKESEKNPGQESTAVEAKANPARETTIKILDPGAEPRQVLRYKFQAGRLDSMVMELKMSMSMDMGKGPTPEITVPPIRMTMDIASKEVTAAGDLRYEFKLTKAEVVPDSESRTEVTAAMQQGIDKVKGMSGYALVTTRGFTKDSDIKVPAGADQSVQQMVGNMRQQIHQLSAPLPEEAVGKGARWVVTMPFDTDAFSFTQTATYTLDEFKEGTAKLSIQLVQETPPQKMKTNAPGVQEILLTSFKSKGEGSTAIDLARLIPASEVRLATDMSMTVDAGGTKQAMSMKMGIGVKIWSQ